MYLAGSDFRIRSILAPFFGQVHVHGVLGFGGSGGTNKIAKYDDLLLLDDDRVLRNGELSRLEKVVDLIWLRKLFLLKKQTC